MARSFDDMLASSAGVVDRRYGEDFQYRPMKAAPNARAAPDTDRAIQTITAVYGDSFARANEGPARHPFVDRQRGGHASSRPIAEFDLAQLPYGVATGDRLFREKTSVLYQISEPRHDGFGRMIVDLNQVG